MEVKQEQVNYLIQYFNMVKGTRYKFSVQANIDLVTDVLNKNDDISYLKSLIDKENTSDLQKCFRKIANILSYYEKPKDEPAPTPVDVKPSANANANDVEYHMGILEKVLADVVVQTQGDKIANGILENIGKKVDDYIIKNYGVIEKKINVVINDKKAELQGVLHEKFDTILKFVSNKEPVFLTGPAGSGKNVLCKQIAQALGLNFYFTNAVTQEYKITGFTDAMGNYQETSFYKAFKNGGLFMLDEMDASIPEVLVILNSAIANGYFDFPAPIGYVEAHPDFRVISAGNTFGLGADYDYVGRNQLDMASLDRFALVKIDYDEKIELSVTNGNKELVTFAHDFRKACEKASVRALISYRALGRIAKMEEALGLEETMKTCLVKNLQKDDLNMILTNMKKINKYRTALNDIKEAM